MVSASAPRQVASKINYPNAHVIPDGPGEKKRASRLRREVDALVLAGTVDAGAVTYISSRFWLVCRDGQTCFVHLNGDNLEWHRIAEPGWRAKDGIVRISPDKSLSLLDGDYLVMRRLVNKYRKIFA